METQKAGKDVYRIYLDEPGSPAYMVYNKETVDKLLEKLLLKYGKKFSVTLKKVEATQ